jgi:hypothetical protein
MIGKGRKGIARGVRGLRGSGGDWLDVGAGMVGGSEGSRGD